MGLLYNLFLILVSAFHILLGLGYHFKVPPYDPSALILDGNPARGETGLEKLFEAVLVGWYLGSITAILAAVYSGDRPSVRLTLLCPLIYHAYLTYIGIFHADSWGIFYFGARGVYLTHGVLTVVMSYLFVKT